jgi:urease accessory protein
MTTTLIRTEQGAPASDAPVRVITRQTALRPMVLSADTSSVRIALVAQHGLLLADDQISIDVYVDGSTHVALIEPAGTVAYHMRGRSAAWDVTVQVADGGSLTWHGEPFVLSEGAEVRRTMHAALAGSARLLVRETVVLGRTGERGGRLHSSTRISDATGPLLVEDLAVGGDQADVVGSHRVIDTVLALGRSVPDIAAADRMVLERGGALWRRLGRDTHSASLEQVFGYLASTDSNS